MNSNQTLIDVSNRKRFVASIVTESLKLKSGESRNFKSDNKNTVAIRSRFSRLKKKSGVELSLECIKGNIVKITRIN